MQCIKVIHFISYGSIFSSGRGQISDRISFGSKSTASRYLLVDIVCFCHSRIIVSFTIFKVSGIIARHQTVSERGC